MKTSRKDLKRGRKAAKRTGKARKLPRKGSRTEGGPAAGLPEVFTLTSLEQVRTLADPLRVRILEQLCREERTTKQVAQILGERPTRLYHHVDALEKAGLIRLARTRQNRGTLEKYYISVARAFRTDPRLFMSPGGGEEAEALQGMLSTVLGNTQMEMQQLLATGCGPTELEEQGTLSYLEIQGSTRLMKTIQGKLERLIKESVASQKKAEGKAKPGTRRRYRLTVAFFPLDLCNGDPPGADGDG